MLSHHQCFKISQRIAERAALSQPGIPNSVKNPSVVVILLKNFFLKIVFLGACKFSCFGSNSYVVV